MELVEGKTQTQSEGQARGQGHLERPRSAAEAVSSAVAQAEMTGSVGREEEPQISLSLRELTRSQDISLAAVSVVELPG